KGILQEITRSNQRINVTTSRGRKYFRTFQQRYIEYLNVFEIYGAVDLDSGDFALSQYYKMDDDEWEEFIEDDRWDDLRVAVAEHKGICPFELVFFEFFHEGSFFS